MRPIDAKWNKMPEGCRSVDILAFLPTIAFAEAMAVVRLHDGQLKAVPIGELNVPPDEISKLRG